MSEKENEDRCDQFWNAIEKDNSAMSIKLLEEQDLIDVEQSVRSGIMNDFCSSSVAEDTTKSETKSHPIYGPFALQVEKFSFLQGFKKTLLAISAHIRDNGSNNVGKALKEKQQQQPSNIFKRSARSAQVSSQSTVSESGESKQAGETSHRIDIVKERSILLNRIIDWIKSFFIPDVFEKIIVDLVRHNKLDTLRTLIGLSLIHESKPLACFLLSLSNHHDSITQMALDMLHKLKADSIIVEVLLGQGKIIDALRLAKSLPGGDSTLSARKYLEAAYKSDPLVFYSVYSYFQQRNIRLRGSPDFLKNELCGEYIEHYQNIFCK